MVLMSCSLTTRREIYEARLWFLAQQRPAHPSQLQMCGVELLAHRKYIEHVARNYSEKRSGRRRSVSRPSLFLFTTTRALEYQCLSALLSHTTLIQFIQGKQWQNIFQYFLGFMTNSQLRNDGFYLKFNTINNDFNQIPLFDKTLVHRRGLKKKSHFFQHPADHETFVFWESVIRPFRSRGGNRPGPMEFYRATEFTCFTKTSHRCKRCEATSHR